MSYCRFSTNDHQCDVYVYESRDGIATHVSSGKYVFLEPLPDPVPFDDTDAWWARHAVIRKLIASAAIVPIGLPHDGECRIRQTHHEAAKWLEYLRGIGYRVPQHAIDGLREDAE